MKLSEYSFTPSELILLTGEKFSPESNGENQLSLLCNDGSVDGMYLASLMCAAAILANEDENAMTLEIIQTRKMMGLKESTHLIIRPAGSTPNWNGFTLESGVLFIASQAYAVPGDYSVYNTIFNIMVEAQARPWLKIVELVEWGLAASNWLLPVSGEAAAAFTTPFICPAHVRDLVLAQPTAPVVNLLTTCKKARPEIWRQMNLEINQAFADRKKNPR
jgi:hypothetical protein